MRKYIFVAGGVMSGVGKGVATASIGKIIQSRGFRVTAMKIDPYVNVDAGTMNPTEHGEVFVLDDGTECDQDMGNYERFLNCDLSGANYMTTGSVYQAVINRERSMGYGGKCVEVVPHIPLEVIGKIERAAAKHRAEITIIEIGGTVGEYQNILFLEAVRMLKVKQPHDVLLVLVSYLPLQGSETPKSSAESGTTGQGELKTKPTQYAVRTLNSAGLQPDFILARAPAALDARRKEKIAFNCNLREEDIISAPNVESIYEIPVNFEKGSLSSLILGKLRVKPRRRNLRDWQTLIRFIRSARTPVKIGIVGKYFGSGEFILADSYISVIEAIKHAAHFWKRKPVIEWINSESFEKDNDKLKELSGYHGVIVPGGFGERGVEGKVSAIRYLREKKIPFLGLCYGMQLAVVEYARSVLKLDKAQTTEINQKTPHPVIDVMPEQKKNLAEKNYGATMRLGAYPAHLKAKSIAHMAYNKGQIANRKGQKRSRKPFAIRDLRISERHRHRYEVNPQYIARLEKKGLVFSGVSPDRRLMEIMELPREKHPFFVGTQFHPELKSRPLNPHPLFREFIKAAIARK
ncbi:MAG: CTP synthase [Candidatus Liptonbacteria bacterium]|nr:CTP synthase [Candidatus Liptonbacteria bacterium]